MKNFRWKLVFALALGLVSCGKNDEPTLDSAYSVASGAVATFDATNVANTNTGPTGYCSPNTWIDSSGSLTGTLTNFNCTSTSGWQGSGPASDPYYLYFDGTNDSVTTNLDVSSAAMPVTTWIMWVKPNQLNAGDQQWFMSMDNHGGDFGRSIGIAVGTSKLGAFVGTGPVWTTNLTVSTGTWYQVAVVFKSTDVVVYLNGQSQSFGSAEGTSTTGIKLSLGASDNGAFQFYQGGIAWAAVYDRELSSSDIINTCRALSSRFPGSSCN